MKTKITSLISPIICIFLGLSLVFACQKINPLDGVELTVNNDVYISPIWVRAVNADASSKVFPSNAVATISGQDANMVVGDLGDKGSDIKMVNGIMTLNLLPEANPSPNKPINLNVFVKCEGFISTNQSIKIIDAKTPIQVEIPMVSLTTPPNGVTIGQKTLSLNQGIAIATTQIVALGGNSKPESVIITIPVGTKMQDDKGNVIDANSLDVQIAHFGVETRESFISMPGGLIVDNVNRQDGTKSNITFDPAGGVVIEMLAGGKSVKSFSTPIDVTVGISKNLINPITKLNVKVGDIIPVWSLNNETGVCTEEGKATIKSDVSGNLVTSFNVKHLSTWWFAWGGDGPYKAVDCPSIDNFTVNVKSNLTKENAIYDYYVTVEPMGRGGIPYSNTIQHMYDGLSFIIPKMPAVENAYIAVAEGSYNNARILGKSAIFNPCKTGSIDVNIVDNTGLPLIGLNLDFSAKCSNKDLKFKPSGWISTYDTLRYKRRNIYAEQGKLSTKVEEGRLISLTVFDGRKSHAAAGMFSKKGSTFEPYRFSIYSSDGLSGTTTYDAVTNTVNLNAVYTSNNCK